MRSLKKISVLALLCLISSPAWSGKVNFCKVKQVYDEKDLSQPPHVIYQDCSGQAYLGSIGKDAVKASCWAGATNLLEGKCEDHKDKDAETKADTVENLEDSLQAE